MVDPKKEETEGLEVETEEEPEVNEVEQIALDMGWKSEDEYEGDDDDFVDAETYIRRGGDIQETMRKHIKEQKKKLADMDIGLRDIKDHNERVYKAEVTKLKKEIEGLKEKKREAIEEGDADLVESIDTQIDEIEGGMVEPAQKMTPNPEFEEWIKKNTWYRDDPEMADYADARSEIYKGAPYSRILKKVEKDVKDMFEDKFPGGKKPGATSVEKTTRRKGKVKYTKSDLNDEQRAVMKRFVAQGIMSEADYINDLSEMGEIGG